MAWKKIQLNPNMDQILMIQNSSILPHSVVKLVFTTDTVVTDDKAAFELTGPNTWSGRVKAGTNVFYEEIGGGILSYSAYDIESLENYNIEPKHEDLHLTEAKVITVPEGAYFVIQNKSKDELNFSIVGTGTFVLVERQMLSFTFTRDTDVKIYGVNHDISYFYSESPSLTQLSRETREFLENLNAKAELLARDMVLRPELLEVNKKTYHGQYSLPSLAEVTNITPGDIVINTPAFKIDETYSSLFPLENEIIDVLFEISYMSEGNKCVGSCGISFIFDPQGAEQPNIKFTCYDEILRKIIKYITLDFNATQGVIKPSITMFDWYLTENERYEASLDMFTTPITTKTRVRSEHAKWVEYSNNVPAEGQLRAVFDEHPNKYVDFMTTKLYNNMVKTLAKQSLHGITTVTIESMLAGQSGQDSIDIQGPNNIFTLRAMITDERTIQVNIDTNIPDIKPTDGIYVIYFTHKTEPNKSIIIPVHVLKTANTLMYPVVNNDVKSFTFDLINPKHALSTVFDNLKIVVDALKTEQSSYRIKLRVKAGEKE